MIRPFRRLCLLLLLTLYPFIVSPLAAVEVSPVFNARLLGGQYFFQNQESNLSGNVGFTAAPAVAFNDRWSLIPTVAASWRGTKSVQDLVGGGTLFQQTQDHSAGVKGIFAANEAWQFKAGSGYRLQLLKETQDESWDKGLFDFQKVSSNLEIERIITKDASVRMGYDFYWIDFRNYSSLESQQRDLGRENAGEKTLNTNNHAPYLAVQFPFGFFNDQKAKFDVSYYYTFRNFTQQTVVLVSGSLSNQLRRDKSQIATANLALPFLFTERFKLLSEIRATFNGLKSDQNNYDARKTQFNSNYYSYKEYSGGPNLSFILGEKPWILSAGFIYARRSYDARPVQDAAGNYGSDKIGVNEYYANFGASYPVSKNFRVQALGNFGWSRSNMTYEKTYRYNYETFTYLLGVVYDY